MAFVFTFLLIAGLEIAAANDKSSLETDQTEVLEEPDMCVGCDDKDNEEDKPKPQLIIEIRIDSDTGKIQYVIKEMVIE